MTLGFRRRRALGVLLIACAGVALVAAGCTHEDAAGGAGAGALSSATAQGVAPSSTAVLSPTAKRSTGGPADTVTELDGLTVLSARPDVPTYQRGCGPGQRCSFGAAWTDDSAAPDGHNGCGTRNDVLQEQLNDVVFKDGSGCVVVAGTLRDPYTGTEISFRKADAADVQIDHVYPLARAFDMGAAGWPQERRTAFANDTDLELLAVAAAANQAKGDYGPAEWMPPDPNGACAYVGRYISIAWAYQLAITAAEHDTLSRVLASCG